MSQKNQVRYQSNCQEVIETPVVIAAGSGKDVPSQKRKEDAKQTLYLNRI
jgi:hypothetical protein